MLSFSAEQFAQRVIDANLLDERQLESIWSELGSREAGAEEFKQVAVRREMLTNYQVEKLIRGDRSGFFYGDYQTLYLVGTGTFARVYRAVHRASRAVVALKVLRNRFSNDPEETKSFLREGRMGKTLRHKNIVPIHEVNTFGKAHYLVMDFVEGRNLREFVKVRKKLNPSEAIDLTVQIADGLDYAFDRGITHRDMKLSNVLVSSVGTAQLVDFGLAAASEKQSTKVEDHPNPRAIDYAGLERATGVRKDDKRSDVYFLGCMLYHMLTGHAPLHETKHRIQRLSVSRFQEVTPIMHHEPHLAQHLVMVVKKAMQLNPNSRYQSPGEMREDLKIASQKMSRRQVTRSDQEVPKSESSSIDIQTVVPQTTAAASHTLMLVESDSELQDLMREKLKKRGFRVLVTSDPTRALGRFENSDEPPADCVIFSTRELASDALRGFNTFGELKRTRKIPAILLLDEEHSEWTDQANTSVHRNVVQMPIKLSQLKARIDELLALTVDP